MRLASVHLPSFAVAVALLVTTGHPASEARIQGQPAVTISGTAERPDGSPAGGLPVAIKTLQKPGRQTDAAINENQDKGKGEAIFRTLAEGATNDAGRFSLSVTPMEPEQTVTIEIGQSRTTHWAKRQLELKGKDVDIGKIRLREPVRG